MVPLRSDRLARKPYSRPASDGQWLHDKADSFKKPRSAVGGRAPVRPSKPIPNNKVVVSNLHYEVTEKDLTSIFGQIGTLIREPQIRYDRSGRSTGMAHVTFESIAEATRAMNQFDGILAKGQPMSVAYEASVPQTRRAVSASSLLHRMEKPPLLDRLSKDDLSLDAKSSDSRTAGPIRTHRRGGGAGANPRPLKKQIKKPKTADELDKELDAFMDVTEGSNSVVAPAAATDAAKAQDQDSEMS